MFKRVLATVLFLLVLSVRPATAQYTYKISDEEKTAYTAAVENCDSPSLECLVKNTTRFVAMEWVNDIIGSGAEETQNLTPASDAGSATQLASRTGMVGNMTKLIVGMYAYPPARTERFVVDVIHSTGVEPAYAQGLGFAALDPVLDLWKKFRNVAYFFFIFLFIIIGFMIMFRSKIGGQAAITAQQAIPSILISLILVTFSYAISGFLIDLMYLSMFMIVGIFGEITTSSGAASNLISMNIFSLGGELLKSVKDSLGQTTDIINLLIKSMIGTENALTGIVSIISGLTLSLVLAVAIVIALFRLFFELLKSYATIVVNVVTAPIILMFGAIPGKNVFSGWIMSMIGNLAAFPAVLLVIVLFYEFTEAGSGGVTVKTGGFMPPFLVGSGNSNVASALLGFALLLALPDVVKKIKEKLGAKAGLGEEIAGWAGKNTLRGADLGLPVGASAFEGTRRGLVGGYAALKAAPGDPHYRGVRGLWRGITEGVKVVDGDKTYVRGGAKAGLSAGFRFGQQGRKVLDDLKDGRILQPDNLRAQLERIEKGAKPPKKDSEAPQTPQPSANA